MVTSFTSWVILFFSLLLPISAYAAPIINEIMWAGSDLSTSDEWVEITRTQDNCAEPLSLSGLTLTVVNTTGVEVPVVSFGPRNVDCNEYLIISNYPAEESRLASTPAFVVPALNLPNTQLLVRLRAPDGAIIDEADDGVGAPMGGENAPSPGMKASMERIDFSLDGGLKSNWMTASISTGFDPNAGLFGTPGFPNSPAQNISSAFSESASSIDQNNYSSSLSEPLQETNNGSSFSSLSSFSSFASLASFSSSLPLLIISELLPNPVGSDSDEWIELANVGTEPIDIAGLVLTLSGSTKSYAIPAADTLGFLLLPGEHRAFRKSLTGLPLNNLGSTVLIQSNGITLNALNYSEVPEGISLGRDEIDPGIIRPFCIPTESAPPTDRLPEVGIKIQSGETSGEEKVSINLEAILEPSVNASAECFWDFQDGFQSGSCNPPSHAFSDPGTYDITLTARDYCSNTVKQSVQVNVYAKAKIQSSSSSSLSFSFVSSALSNVSLSVVEGRITGVAASGDVSITGVLPNPPGKDAGSEWVEIVNNGMSTVSFDGWKLRSTIASGRCSLEGLSLKPQEHHKVAIGTCGFTLVNSRGGIELINPAGNSVSHIEWVDAKEGRIYGPSDHSLRIGNEAIVQRVIDGDTIELASGAIVRLLGIDAPEVAHPHHTPDPYGGESLNFLRALIEGKKIELEFDTKREDTYGRLLAYVFLEGQDVQALMLKEGLARVYTAAEFKRKAEYLNYEMQARGDGKGMWVFPLGPANPQPATRQSATHVPIYLSEIYPAPNKGENEWIELFNPNDTPVPLSGWTLDDLQGGGSKPWEIPDDTWIGAGEYMVILSQQSGLKLNDDSDEVWLTSPDQSFSDHLSYSKARKGVALARMSIESSVFCPSKRPTPGTENECIDQKLYSKKPSPKSSNLAKAETHKRVAASLENLKSQLITIPNAQNSPSSAPTPILPIIIISIVSLGGAVGLRWMGVL